LVSIDNLFYEASKETNQSVSFEMSANECLFAFFTANSGATQAKYNTFEAEGNAKLTAAKAERDAAEAKCVAIQAEVNAKLTAAKAERDAAEAKCVAIQAEVDTKLIELKKDVEAAKAAEAAFASIATSSTPSAPQPKPSEPQPKPSVPQPKPSATQPKPSELQPKPSPSPVQFRTNAPSGAVKPLAKKDDGQCTMPDSMPYSMPYSMQDSEQELFTGSTVIFTNCFEKTCDYVPTTPQDAIWCSDMLLAGRFSTSSGSDQGKVRCVFAKPRADGWVIKFTIPKEQLRLFEKLRVVEKSMCKHTGKLQWRLPLYNHTFTEWVDNHRVVPQDDYTSSTPPPPPLLSAYFKTR
jgi:hypothetical protein